MKWLIVFCLTCAAIRVSAAEDTIYLEETVITGNQELPKVLYILPWRDMDTALLPARAFEYQAQSVLVPIRPEEQRRELKLRQLLSDARRSAEPNSKVEQNSHQNSQHEME